MTILPWPYWILTISPWWLMFYCQALKKASALSSDSSCFCMLFLFGAITQYVRFLFKKMPGFFWPDFIAKIRLCSQSQKVYFFPKYGKKFPISKKKRSVLCVFYLNFNSITSNKVFYDFVLWILMIIKCYIKLSISLISGLFVWKKRLMN